MAEIIIDLARFLIALTAHFYWLLGGVAFFLADFCDRFLKKAKLDSVPWKWISIMCVCIAMFLTWRDEYKRMMVTEAALRELSLPKLEARIGPTYGFDDHYRAQLFIGVHIKNLGAPSIAEGYWLEIVLHGEKMTFMPANIPAQGATFHPADPSRKYLLVFYGKDSLYEKTNSTAIEKGGARQGWLRYVLPKIRLSELKNTPYKINFTDVNGKLSSVQSKVGDRFDINTPAVPGLEDPLHHMK
ncbi:MAG: hypothetical protein WD688_18410 [Candidatus Binatia bacterium]